jgi:hypothetical protein
MQEGRLQRVRLNQMKIRNIYLLPLLALGFAIGTVPDLNAAGTETSTASANAIVTVKVKGGSEPAELSSKDFFVYQGKQRAKVTSVKALKGDDAGLQLFIYLDDSSGPSTLGSRLPEIKNFIRSLPETTQVAIGYMRNGGFSLAQPFTTEHQDAINSLRLPMGSPGGNGSPYFALSYLVKHWPSKEHVQRRAVLMLTDGVDRYYSNRQLDDPYVDAAIKDSQHLGVLVYSIYLHGSGFSPAGGWSVTMAQSRLQDVSNKTGGECFLEGLTTPVSLTPYLNQLNDRLAHQYEVTFVANKDAGLQPITIRSELPAVKFVAPQSVAVRGSVS